METWKYECCVISGGILYRAGEPVPFRADPPAAEQRRESPESLSSAGLPKRENGATNPQNPLPETTQSKKKAAKEVRK